MTTDHHDQAIAHIQAVRAARQSLRDMYREDFRDPRDVARLNADLGDALKLADVHATLAVAQAIDNLADLFDVSHAGTEVVQFANGEQIAVDRDYTVRGY